MATDTASENNRATFEAQIRELIEHRAEAVRAKDLNKVMSDHAPNILLFDVLNPSQYSGADAARKRTEEWFSWYGGPIGFEIRDLSITASEDVAFCHYLYHVTGTMTNGTQVDMWVRTTVCYCKIDGGWKATHEHNSVPFDAESGKASLDLKP